MVTSVTSLGRSGVYDWLVQRITSVSLGAYVLFMFGYFLATPDLSYEAWKALFSNTWMRIFTISALVSLGGHVWVGLWTMATDYLKNTVVRFTFQAICGVIMFVYFVWGIQILWGL